MLADMIGVLDRQVDILDLEIARRAKAYDIARRLMTIPGIGPITATALAALAPPPEVFSKGRDFAGPALRNAQRSLMLGLTTLQKSTDGTQRPDRCQHPTTRQANQKTTCISTGVHR